MENIFWMQNQSYDKMQNAKSELRHFTGVMGAGYSIILIFIFYFNQNLACFSRRLPLVCPPSPGDKDLLRRHRPSHAADNYIAIWLRLATIQKLF